MPDRTFVKALKHHQAGELTEAEAIYRQMMVDFSDHSGCRYFLGVLFEDRGDLVMAAELIGAALALAPAHPERHVKLGDVYRLDERLDEAAACYRSALELDPGLAGVEGVLGNVLYRLGRVKDAVACCRRAADADPNDTEVHNILGTALLDLGDIDGAKQVLKRALALTPGSIEAISNMGSAYHRAGELENAVISLRQALKLEPRYSFAARKLGLVYEEMGRLDEALQYYDHALETDVDDAEAHFLKAGVLMLLGRLDEGWQEYEWRWKKTRAPTLWREFPAPRWNGRSARGINLLVWGEQGIGEQIMFASMVSDLTDAGASVTLESEPRLAPLFQRSFPAVHCVERSDPPAPEAADAGLDAQTPAGSLGRWCRQEFSAFPERSSYLIADSERSDALRTCYQNGTDDVLIGISWCSINPEIGGRKSMPLFAWRRLLERPGITVVDLQYGDTANERRDFEVETGIRVIHDDGVDPLADLDAFAAQVAAMDLVISVSNTTVHMAGALGVPTWVMLSTAPLWRWFVGREDSPWYGSVRLFRQQARDEWGSVLKDVEAELTAFIGGLGR